MVFRKAVKSDLADICAVYRAAIRYLDDQGIDQWDDIYPSAKEILEDIENNEMYLGVTDGIACAFTLNTKHDSEYDSGAWQYPNAHYCVIHRLCVNPASQGNGIGTEAMCYIENLQKNKFEAIRLDAFSQNPTALHLYEKLGYRRAGEVRFRKGSFYLYEKKL